MTMLYLLTLPADLDMLPPGTQYRVLCSGHGVLGGKGVIESFEELDLPQVETDEQFTVLSCASDREKQLKEIAESIATWETIPDPAEKDALVQSRIAAIIEQAYPNQPEKVMGMRQAVMDSIAPISLGTVKVGRNE